MQAIIKEAIAVLKSGGIILYPTDTIWGIGCDACNEAAAERIIQLKKRSETKSFIVLLDQDHKLESYVKEIPAMAWDLLEFAENPLTLILPGAKNLARQVINEDGSVGIRIVKKGFAHELIKKYRFPITSTSANISGEPSALNFEAISEEIKSGVDYICHAEDTGSGKASTIMKLEINGQFSFIRQ